jgi:inosine/xanthosine triphosphate pyrophosphatase family protein
MAKLTINVGSSANSGGGDALRDAMVKINSNFDELYNTLGSVSALEDGQLRADIQGSIFADDSTLLVDAVNGEIPGYVSLATLQSVVAASADFADFQTRIAALT